MKLFSRVRNTGLGQRVRFLRLFSGWSFQGTRVWSSAACECGARTSGRHGGKI